MIALQLAVVLLLILLNGLFAMAEMAVVSSRATRLQSAVAHGRRGARTALRLKRDPGRFLSTVQIGITLVGVLASTLGGATLADRFATALAEVPALAPYAQIIAFGAVVLAITYFSLVLGELVPKRLALAHPERIAMALARMLRVISRIATPAEVVLSASTNLVLRLLPKTSDEPAAVTEEEITLMLREGAAAGHFHEGETAIVQMALRLGDRRVSALMTPRTQVEWLDLQDGEAEHRRKILTSPYSRFPVVDGGPQQVVGIVQVKDLLAAQLAGKALDLRAALRPARYLPNTVTALRALEMFKTSGDPMALVVDEYGDFEGVVTLTDILQALVGDIATPGETADPPVVRRADGSWLIDGMVGIDEVKDVTGIRSLPGEESGDFHTLGGFIMAQMKRVPTVADHIMVDAWRFEVVDMDGRRVDRVLVQPPPRRD